MFKLESLWREVLIEHGRAFGSFHRGEPWLVTQIIATEALRRLEQFETRLSELADHYEAARQEFPCASEHTN